ncbi:MAG: hypothetical protein U0X20_00365 [Caldilineaceae bacterium]
MELFWELCGCTEPFPRTLERSLALALPVVLIKLPRLHLAEVEQWISRRGTKFQFGCQSRPVRGCIIAQGGNGLIFVDGTDSPDEQRMTVAHEVGHFLADYWLPRTKAVKRFGPSILDVLDGIRPATITERVHAVLGSSHIGPYTTFLERGDLVEGAETWKVEERSDQIALTLLAPAEYVYPLLDVGSGKFAERVEAAAAVLRGQFGLPEEAARAYGRMLLISVGKGPSWLESLHLG